MVLDNGIQYNKWMLYSIKINIFIPQYFISKKQKQKYIRLIVVYRIVIHLIYETRCE